MVKTNAVFDFEKLVVRLDHDKLYEILVQPKSCEILIGSGICFLGDE